MRRRFMLFAGVLTLFLLAGPLWSQDSHYWTEQFGNRARLLGGAVIGGGSDIAVVYYNPGALALMENPEILLAGNVFEVRNVSADPISPAVEGSSSTSFSLSPSLFAGQLRNEVLGGQFAYSFLTRSRADFRLAAQSSLPTDEVDIPNVSFASNNVLVEQRLGDYWFGGTWARAFGERIGLGISTFFAIRSQTTRFQDAFTVLAEDNRAAVSSEIRDFSFYNGSAPVEDRVGDQLGEMEVGSDGDDAECLVVWKWNVHGRLVPGGARRRPIGKSAYFRGIRSAKRFRGVPFAVVDRNRGVSKFRGHEAVFVWGMVSERRALRRPGHRSVSIAKLRRDAEL